MSKFINWLAGPYPKIGSLLFMTLQFVLIWLAIGETSKQYRLMGGFWNIYWTAAAIMMGLFFIKVIVRLIKHGPRSIIYQEKW